ncbi:MAG: aminotransferase class I/II-fold pyridoxal phosphate-dependent enzyme [Anaerolineales bacterium]|nr:aminotransferase class I/II-fold pyridoxal phosphate-dependent enzyme [Anaerolineales bacterium]
MTEFQPAARLATLPASFFYGLNQAIARLRQAGVDVIRMDMGSPDLPPAPHILARLAQVAADPNAHGYQPFAGTPSYRAAWAEFYGRRFGVELDPVSEIMGLLGSKGTVFNLPVAMVNPGDVVLIPDPGYNTYTAGATFARAECVYMPLTHANHFLPDFQAIPEAVWRRTRLMWLNYPNNPTGATAPLELFAQAVALARQYGFLLAHDAPYTEITFDGYQAPSVMQIPGAKDVAVEFHSLSKTANMAGWRVAVLVGNPSVLRIMQTLQSNAEGGHFLPILAAAEAALVGDHDWMAQRNEVYRERRDLVVSAVRAAGLYTETPQAALYVWVHLPRGVDDTAYAEELLEATGVSVTPGLIFGEAGRGFVRLSLGTATPRVREAMARWRDWAKRKA